MRTKFKKLSIKLHPDKNKDDPEANARFNLLKKSYNTLTNIEMYKNWVE